MAVPPPLGRSVLAPPHVFHASLFEQPETSAVGIVGSWLVTSLAESTNLQGRCLCRLFRKTLSLKTGVLKWLKCQKKRPIALRPFTILPNICMLVLTPLSFESSMPLKIDRCMLILAFRCCASMAFFATKSVSAPSCATILSTSTRFGSFSNYGPKLSAFNLVGRNSAAWFRYHVHVVSWSYKTHVPKHVLSLYQLQSATSHQHAPKSPERPLLEWTGRFVLLLVQYGGSLVICKSWRRPNTMTTMDMDPKSGQETCLDATAPKAVVPCVFAPACHITRTH